MLKVYFKPAVAAVCLNALLEDFSGWGVMVTKSI